MEPEKDFRHPAFKGLCLFGVDVQLKERRFQMRNLKAYLLLVVMILLASCRRDHLYYASSDTATLLVEPDWTSSGVRPNGVTVFAFNESDGSLYKRFPPVGADQKCYIKLPEGDFTLVVMNDTPEEFDGQIEFTGEDNIETFQAKGVQNKVLMSKSLIIEPDTLLVSKVEGVHISPEQVDYFYDRPQSDISVESAIALKTRPEMVVSEIKIYVHVKGLKYSKGITSSSLRGLSSGWHIGQGQNLSERVSQSFIFTTRDYNPSLDEDGTLEASFLSFGFPNDMKAYEQCFLDIDFLLINGDTYPVSIDVSDMISIDISLIVNISLEIELPKIEGEQGGGFDTNINEWDDEILDIPM